MTSDGNKIIAENEDVKSQIQRPRPEAFDNSESIELIVYGSRGRTG